MEFINFDLSNILQTYGLPTTLAFLFIWFYKQSSDKYNKFLKDAIQIESKRADKADEIIREIHDVRLKTDDLTSKTTELHKSVMSYLLKDKG